MEHGRNKLFVYKYMTFEPKSQLSRKKAKDLIVDSNLYLAAPSEFNDPYESLANISLTLEARRRREYFERSAKAFLKENPDSLSKIHGRENKVREIVRNAMRNSIESSATVNEALSHRKNQNGVSCFSEDPRSILMWSYYAGGHTGICLQFDISDDPGVLLLTHRVNYVSALPHLIWPDDREQIVDKVILCKSNEWKHECEVRYVSMMVVRDSLPFDGASLKGIILGSRFPEESLAELKVLLDSRRSTGLPDVCIYQARHHAQRYGIQLARRLPS